MPPPVPLHGLVSGNGTGGACPASDDTSLQKLGPRGGPPFLWRLLSFRPPPPAAAAAPVALSPLLVTADWRLVLPAYDDLEIGLTPLPKALYLFFLALPPAGLPLPTLADHQPALLAHYRRLRPQLDEAAARARIRELTDVRLNSLHEKLARIKAAFARQLAAPLARHYDVRGSRGGPKGVALPRHLLHWPP